MKNILLISFSLLFVASCSKSSNPVADDTPSDTESSITDAVSIANFTFNPSTLTISIGDIVTWTNTSGTHSVVSDDGLFTSSSLSSGDTFQHQFDTVGEFGYKCGFHSSMTGSITVTE